MVEALSFDSRVFIITLDMLLNTGPELIQRPNNSKIHYFSLTAK